MPVTDHVGAQRATIPLAPRTLTALLVVLCSLSSTSLAAPRLVLQITVDGLRADLLDRHAANFGPGGFNYLRGNGVEFRNAHYLHANTETIVGHTTLATGATPAVHGMVGNVWYHASTGELGYNIEDPTATLLPTREDAGTGAQVDPAQQRAGSQGRSPQGILVPTFSDTLSIATAGRAKIFGVSGKDRSAVAMAGKTGTAYWYSTDTGDFQTSRYYRDAYPAWVRDWNGERKAARLAGSAWQLLLDKAAYPSAERDDRPYEVDLRGYARTFPHPFGDVGDPLFFTRVLISPHGDRLLLDFAKALMRAEGVGDDATTDYLSISFSGVDAVNHFFGVASLENEDVLIQLDRTLAELFEFVDEEIGLEHVLIVLSADHGMPEMPEYATELGHRAGRLHGDEVLELARETAQRLYGDRSLIKDFFRPYLYLDPAAVEDMDRAAVAAAIARELAAAEGIGDAVATAELGTSTDPTTAAVRHNHHPQRSGDVYVIQAPYWFLFERGAVAAIHGSPWRYDTHVPLLFAGPGIQPATVHRLVHPIDVAPTLSALLDMAPPAAAQGKVLVEVVAN